MKQTFIYICLIAVTAVTTLSCKKDSDYISGTISPFISNFDLKKSFKGTDLTLTKEVMNGASSIKGVVISDFTLGNTPVGLLVVQNSRTVGNGIDSVRGVAFNIGADAAKFTTGDSVHINVEGGVLKRVDNILQITGVSGSAISKIAANRKITTPVVTIKQLVAAPDVYENRLVTIGKGMFEVKPGDTFAGDKSINDGSGIAIMHTETSAGFSSVALPGSGSASLTGVIYFKGQSSLAPPQLWMRNADDATELATPVPSPVIITGYLTDPPGTDASTTAQYEYIQLMATEDINFAVTPFSVVTTNNAGSANLAPVNGWATGGARTYKINLTSGTVQKGQFFYVGGVTKLIWGPNSTNMASAKWIASVNYASSAGADFGTATTNLLANSGNIAGIAVFKGTAVTANSVPMDVIMYGGSNANSGNVYGAGPPPVGYRITNTDYYSTINPSSTVPKENKAQYFFGAGSNIERLGFQITQANPTGGSFVRLGGVYVIETGVWNTKRTLSNFTMALTTQVSELETGTGITVLTNK
jgi:hypothetical protein